MMIYLPDMIKLSDGTYILYCSLSENSCKHVNFILFLLPYGETQIIMIRYNYLNSYDSYNFISQNAGSVPKR